MKIRFAEVSHLQVSCSVKESTLDRPHKSNEQNNRMYVEDKCDYVSTEQIAYLLMLEFFSCRGSHSFGDEHCADSQICSVLNVHRIFTFQLQQSLIS